MKTMVRYTVDLPRPLHKELSQLAAQQGKTKAYLVREAIAQMPKKGTLPVVELRQGEKTYRYTLDMELAQHKALSLLAVRQRRSKAELVRGAIGVMVGHAKTVC